MRYRMLIAVMCLASAWMATWSSRGVAEELSIDSVVLTLIDEVRVPAREAGPLAELLTREGARVKAGDLLAQIDPDDAALEVARAKLALEHAEEQAANEVPLKLARQRLKIAELDLKNAEDANKQLPNVVSDSQMQKLRTDVEKGKLEIEQATREAAAAQRAATIAKHDLRVAQREVERRRITAPSDGVVVEVRRHVGEWVQPGEAVLRIVKDDRLRAEGFVVADRLAGTIVGRPAVLQVTQPDESTKSFTGTVTFVSPEANPVNGQVRVWAEFENRDGQLRAGLSAQLRIKSAAAAERSK